MQKTITKEEIKQLPPEQFQGRITIIENSAGIVQLIDQIKDEKVLGFDTETKPTFKKGVIHQVSLLQLSTPHESFLVRLNHTGFTPGLAALLSNPSILKVGVGIRDDLRALKRLRRFKPQGFIELQEMVTDYGIEVFSLKNLAGLLLGIRVSKRQQLSNWEAPALTEAQAIYAATDAWVSLRIYETLQNMLPLKKTSPNRKSLQREKSS